MCRPVFVDAASQTRRRATVRAVRQPGGKARCRGLLPSPAVAVPAVTRSRYWVLPAGTTISDGEIPERATATPSVTLSLRTFVWQEACTTALRPRPRSIWRRMSWKSSSSGVREPQPRRDRRMAYPPTLLVREPSRSGSDHLAERPRLSRPGVLPWRHRRPCLAMSGGGIRSLTRGS